MMVKIVRAGGCGVAVVAVLCVFCVTAMALALRGSSAEQRPEILRALAEVFRSMRGRQ